MSACVLGVFLKAPRVGEVKTRLAADIGAARAAEIYRSLAEAVAAATAPAEGDGYEQVLCFAPESAGEEVAAWLPGRRLEAQADGDLGQRMAHALGQAFRRGAPKAALVGSDVPGLRRGHVREAYRALRAADLVLGPTPDGGYYLVGMSRLHPALFQDMPWSTPQVLPLTLARAGRLGLRTVLLEELRDVDTIDDLRALGILLEV